VIDLDRRSQRGQVLPLFALFLVVLFGFAALAIDVSGALAARRFYRSVADSASLAGAQDLQVPGTRAVTAVERIRARQHAMDDLTTELGISPPLPAACATTADTDVPDTCVLPGTDYHVSIRAGTATGPTAIACQNCDPARSVQVGLRNGTYGLTFARVLGQTSWNVGVTSVAGLEYGKAYAIETLRPPKALGSGFAVNDIEIDGGSVVNVQHGDVGSNANMDYSGGGSILNLDSGYGMFYFDPLSGPGWSGPPAPPTQVVQKLQTLIADPNYRYPAMRGSRGSATCAGGPPANCAPTFTDARTSTCGAPGANPACTRADLDPLGCGAEATYLQTSVYTFMATQALNTIYCYQPGIYDPSSNSKQLSSGTGTVVLLMPGASGAGAYYFKSPNGGLDISGRLLGGYRPGVPGVSVMFDECNNQCIFSGNNAVTIALNAGTKFPPGTAGSAATASVDWNDQLVQTSGPASPTPPLLLTLLVNKNPACFVPTSPPFQEPAACDPGTHDKTINIAGGGSLALEGVQYAPTDNIEIHGGSAGNGQVGQIIAYTIFYSGGTHINQEGPPSQGPGTLRLDAACTAPGTPCNP
jgi:hypothetical protein